MLTLEVYDPPMCCPSGACGPAVDPRLAQFAADLDWVRRQGVTVQRFGLSQRPDAFVRNAEIVKIAADGGLPAFTLDGRIVHVGGYPTRGELARWIGVPLHGEVPERRGKANKLEECRSALSEGRLLFICVQGAGAAPGSSTRGARECQATPGLPPSTIVEIEPGDAEGHSVLREIGADVSPDASVVLLLVPPGVLIGQLKGEPTRANLVDVIATRMSCAGRSCPPGAGCCG